MDKASRQSTPRFAVLSRTLVLLVLSLLALFVVGPALRIPWPPDVAYIRLLLNLGVMGLAVGYAAWWSEESIEESRDLVALFVAGPILVAAGVGFLRLVGETDIRGYVLLLEIGLKGALILVGYSLILVGLVELGRKAFRRSRDNT